MVNNTTDNSFTDDVLNAAKPVLVDFYADWCGPCKMMGPIIEELSGDMGSDVDFYKCNVDENPGIAQKYGIMSIPTLMIFKDGEAVNSIVGLRPKEQIAADIKKAL